MKTDLLKEIANDIKTFNVKVETVENLEHERAIVHYISTADRDRGDDIVDPNGMDDEDFAKSPSVWYNHEYIWNPHAMPIGKSLWRKKEDKGVLAKTQFATHEFADDIYSLHKGEYIKSWSIGYDFPKKNGRLLDGAIEYDSQTNITKINLWKLLEYSSAPIAMNPNALDQAKDFRFKSYRASELVKEADYRQQLESRFTSSEKMVSDLAVMVKELQDMVADLKERGDGYEKSVADIIKSIEDLGKRAVTESKQSLGIVAGNNSKRIDKIAQEVLSGAIRSKLNIINN